MNLITNITEIYNQNCVCKVRPIYLAHSGHSHFCPIEISKFYLFFHTRRGLNIWYNPNDDHTRTVKGFLGDSQPIESFYMPIQEWDGFLSFCTFNKKPKEPELDWKVQGF